MSPSLLSSQRITKLVWNRCGSAQDMSWGRCSILQPTRKLSRALRRQDRKRKESLQLYCWNLNIWIRKNLCEILIGGDDISNDIITLGTLFFKVCLHSRQFPLHVDWRKSDSPVDGEPQGNWRQNSNSRDVVANSPFFSHPASRVSQSACLQTQDFEGLG